jgi:hypothetical protein
MKRTRKWHKKLTMKEIRHVNEFCGGTLQGIKNTREGQRLARIKSPTAAEPCWDCRMIARKLGIET